MSSKEPSTWLARFRQMIRTGSAEARRESAPARSSAAGLRPTTAAPLGNDGLADWAAPISRAFGSETGVTRAVIAPPPVLPTSATPQSQPEASKEPPDWAVALRRAFGSGGSARADDAPQSASLGGDLRRLMASARAGDAVAQKAVAAAYLRGEGVPSNPAEGLRWLEEAAGSGDAEAQAKLAIVLFRGVAGPLGGGAFGASGVLANKQAARELAYQAAKAGQVEAQALLGYLLCTGDGVERDYSEAVKWYELAVTGGSAQAALGLGMIRLLGLDGVTDTESAVRFIARAAEAQVATAIYVMGTLHEAGVPPIVANEAVALGFYQRAAEAGVRPAKARLGLALMNGWGTPPDAMAGETWLRRAALEGDVEAAAIVGDLQCSDHHGAPNFLEATQWYQMAAEGGHRTAAHKLGWMHLTGRGVPPDAETAMVWLQRAAEAGDRVALMDLGQAAAVAENGAAAMAAFIPQLHKLAVEGDPVAAFNLAVCLHNGFGVAVDRETARDWFTFAAPHVVNAAYWLGRTLMDGTFGEPDPEAALPWIREAAEQGMPEALALLGDMVLKGRGTPVDEGRALELFERAAEAGHAGAAFACGALLGGGHSVPADRVKAQAWFRRAAEAGHQQAQDMLGQYLLRGLAGEQNTEEAQLWLQRAAKGAGAEAESL